MRKYTLAFFALALLLSACRIESNIVLNINDDGSATVGAEVGFDEEMLDLLSQGGGDPSDILDELPDLGGDNVEPINRVDGDMTYFGAQTNVADLSTYNFEGLSGGSFSEFSYEFDDESATLVAQVDAADIGDLAGGDLPIDPSDITGDIFAARVLVTMPGTVTESNADEILNDGTLVWNLPFTGTKEITATSSFGGSSVNLIWFVLIGVLLLGIVAAVAAVRMSKKDEEKAVADAVASAEEEAVSPAAPAEEAVVEDAGSEESSSEDSEPEPVTTDTAEADPEKTLTEDADVVEPSAAEDLDSE